MTVPQRPASIIGRVSHSPAAPFLAALLFYILTLAPTVLWGDDAEYQRRAYTLEIDAGMRGHPLYLYWAHLFTRLPVGDVAYRVNLCSAFGAAIGVALVWATLRRLGASGRAAWLGAGALAVSHAYWMHAVRAEVYSSYLALFALSLWAGVRWLEERRAGWLALAAGALALSLPVHLLGLTALPALALLFLRCRSPRQALAGAAGFVAGLLPLAGLTLATSSAPQLVVGISGTAMSLLAPARWPRDAAWGLGYLLYQFPLGILLIIPGARRLACSRPWALAFLALAGLGDAAFAFDFQAPDRYVFYLPLYLVLALSIGAGVEALSTRWLAGAWLAAGVVALPVALYLALPMGLNALKLNPLGLRDLPYRNGNLFHLLPAKVGYDGGRQFGQQVLAELPPAALVLADATIRQNLLYFQGVEGLRPDVEVVEIYAGQGRQAPFIEEQIGRRPVFLGAIDAYVDRTEIEARWRIEPYGLIYQVLQR